MSRIALCGLACLLLSLPATAQRGQEPPVLIPPGSEAEAPAETPVEAPAGQDPTGSGIAVPGPGDTAPNQPRPLPEGMKLPYLGNRKLIEVDGNAIYTAELNQLVAYYQSFRPGSIDLLLRDAVEALMPSKVMAMRYRDDLPAMKQRIDEALAAIRSGELSWKDAVAQYSDDYDEENPEGQYVFGRERAVQPFDRWSHTGRVGQIHGPFLTVYGYHFLEIQAYERATDAKDDKTTVRHVLVMYPDLKKRDAADEDIRAFIRAQVRAAKKTVLERGSENLIAPPKPEPKKD